MRKPNTLALSVLSFLSVFLLAEIFVRVVQPAPLKPTSLVPNIEDVDVIEDSNYHTSKRAWPKYKHQNACDFSGITRKTTTRPGPSFTIKREDQSPIQYNTKILEETLTYKNQPILTWSSTLFGDGSRWTPHSKSNKESQHLVFWGCSFTFGSTVEDDQTLPFFVQENTSKYRAYNLARPGSSVAESFIDLEKNPNLSFLTQREGIAIFTVIGAHLPRLAGSYYLMNYYLKNFNYIERNKDGHFYSRGSWEQIHPTQIRFIHLLYLSAFFRWLNMDLYVRKGSMVPNFVGDYADALLDLKNMYLKGTLPSNRFVVFLYPNAHDIYAPYIPALRSELLKRKIEVLDYSAGEFSEISENSTATQVDCHPNKEANRILGQWISEDLNLNN